jgi:hypothetical protein
MNSFIILLLLAGCKKTNEVNKMSKEETNKINKFSDTFEPYMILAVVGLCLGGGLLHNKIEDSRKEKDLPYNTMIWHNKYDVTFDGKPDTISEYNYGKYKGKTLILHSRPDGGFEAVPYTIESKFIENK